MPQIQVLPGVPSFGSQLGKALGGGLSQGISDSLKSFLDNKQAKQISATRDRIAKGTGKFLKEYHPALESNVEAKGQIEQLAQQYGARGFSETDSIKAAINDYNKSRKSQPQEDQSFLGKLFSSNKEVPTDSQSGQEPQNWRDFFSNILTESQQTPGQTPLGPLAKESPGALVGAPALGALAPFEEVARFQSKPAMDFVKSLGFTYPEGAERGPLVTEKLREKLQEGLSPEAKRGAEQLEVAGSFLPIERLLTGLKLIGKSAGFLKNAEKIAAREGISATQAAENIAKQAETTGIDLAKVASGDKKESAKLFNLSNRISSKAPETATELRMARAEPKAKIFPTEERIATRESQLKAFPKYEAEIAQDASERAARAEAKIPKTVKGMDARRIRVHTAEKNLPVAEKGYRNALARVRALEDEVVKLGGAEKERVKSLIDAAKSEMKDAEFFLKQTMQNISGGEARVGLEDMRKAAQKKMLDISEKIAAGEEIQLAKMDYNPEMIREAKRLSKKKAIPSVKKDDFYQQVHKEYGDQYRKQLSDVEKKIKEPLKNMADAERKRHLQKEKDVIKKLIDQTEAERTIHQHKLSLRETAERHRAKERLGKLQPKEAEPKVQKVAQEKIHDNLKSYIANPSEEKLVEIATETGVPKEAVKQGKSLVDAIKEVNKTAEKGTVPKIGKIRAEFELLKKALKASDYKELAQNPFSRGLGQILADYVLNETDLLDTLDIPGGVTALSTVAAGSRGRNPFIRNGIVLFYRLALNNYKIENYVKAVKDGDDVKVSRLNKEYPRRLVRKAKDRLKNQ